MDEALQIVHRQLRRMQRIVLLIALMHLIAAVAVAAAGWAHLDGPKRGFAIGFSAVSLLGVSLALRTRPKRTALWRALTHSPERIRAISVEPAGLLSPANDPGGRVAANLLVRFELGERAPTVLKLGRAPTMTLLGALSERLPHARVEWARECRESSGDIELF